MNTSEQGVFSIKTNEGCRLVAYKSVPSDPWTIGYGSTQGVYKGMIVTESQADRMLRDYLAISDKEISSMLKVIVNQNQFDALSDFCYNLGTGALKGSTLLKVLNGGDYLKAADQFLVWDMAGGKHLAGLHARRMRERVLFLKPMEVFNA